MTSEQEVSKGSSGRIWLEHMRDCLVWKVVGPALDNPFTVPLPYRTLAMISNDRQALKNYIQLRGLADGYEVLFVKSYALCDITTQHPCLVRLTSLELIAFLQESGTFTEIESEKDLIQQHVRERCNAIQSSDDDPESKFMIAKKIVKEAEKPKNDGGVRIVRR